MNEPIPRLQDEIGQGKLCLKADEFSRCRFSFEVDGEPIGCFAIRSFGHNDIRLERAWNVGSSTHNPQTGLFLPGVVAKKFGKIKLESKMKIIEFEAIGGRRIDTVVFKASRVETFDGPDARESSGRVLKFECVDLLGVRFHAVD